MGPGKVAVHWAICVSQNHIPGKQDNKYYRLDYPRSSISIVAYVVDVYVDTVVETIVLIWRAPTRTAN